MHHFWEILIEPVLDIAKPKVIVEIGSDTGANTRDLLAFCEKNGGKLHVIDPLPKYDVAEWEREYGDTVVFHLDLSLNVLPNIEGLDAVLIDGDHNWYTVFNELKLIEKRCEELSQPFPLVLLHDIGWPYGRRDLYYDPDTIPATHRQTYERRGMKPGSNELVESGGLNQGLYNAKHEGGPRNGVLTAVEDFLGETEQRLEFVRLPSLHGLGVLFPAPGGKSEELSGFLDSIVTTLEQPVSTQRTVQLDLVEQKRLELEVTSQEQDRELTRLRNEVRSAQEGEEAERRKLQEVRRMLAETEGTLAEKVETTWSLRERLRENRSSLKRKNRQLSQLREEAKERSQEVEKLARWMKRMDAGTSAILRSRRWKAGSLLAGLSQGAPRNPQEPEAVDSIRKVSKRFRAWQKSRAHKKSVPHPDKGRRARTAVGQGRRESHRRGPDSENGIKRVQVGCGPHNIMDDWWNVDIKGFAGIDAAMDATKPWPYEDLEYVFGEHFLEHLTLNGAIDFLRHAGNSLQTGGIMRLSTPNLEWVLRTHFPLESTDSAEIISSTMKMNRAFHGWGHQFLYTRSMLSYILKEMGLEDIRFFSYGESDTPALKNLERHGRVSVHEGHPSVIIAEATKGEQRLSPSANMMTLIDRDYLRYVRG